MTRQSLCVLQILLLVATMSFAQTLRAATPLWDNLPIGGGGAVTGVYADPNVQNLFYFKTDVGGAYRSDPTASYWIPITDSFTNPDNFGIESLAIDPSHGSTLYILTGQYTYDTPALLKSTNAGDTWTACTIPTGLICNANTAYHARTGEELTVDPNNSSTLYLASTNIGLWKSTNDGASGTWAKVTNFTSVGTGGVGLTFVACDKNSGSTILYVGVWDTTGSTGGVWVSSNGGTSWTQMTGTTENTPTRAVVASDGTLYVAFHGPTTSGGAICKASRGATSLTPITPSTAYNYFAIAVDPTNSAQIYTAEYGGYFSTIYSSSNGGTSWTSAGEVRGVGNYATRNGSEWFGNISQMVVDPFNHTSVWLGDLIGVLNTPNISSATTPWNYVSEGDEETVPLQLTSPPSGAFLLSAIADVNGECHLSLTSSPAQSFQNESTPYSSGSSTSIDFCESNPNVMARVVDSTNGSASGLYSTNGGAAWTYFATIPSGATGGRIAVSATNSSNFVWTPEDGTTYYTTNSGATWTAASGAPHTTYSEFNEVDCALASDRVNGNFYMFGAVSGTGYLYVSTNGGATWTPSTGSISGVGAPSQLKVFTRPGTAGEVWIDIDNANTYFTTNGGTSFTFNPVKSNSLMAYGAPMVPGGTPALYLDGSLVSNGHVGIYRSNNDGESGSWTEIDNPASPVPDSNFTLAGDRQTYGRLYIGTNGRGIFYNELLLDGWTDADINSPTDKGDAVFDGTTYTVIGGGAGVGEPATLVEDQFNDGGLTNGADPLDTAWAVIQSSPVTLSVGAFAASGNTSNAMVYNASGAYGEVQGGPYTSQALNVGDSITLSYDFRVTSATIPSTSSSFRFGLSNSSNTYGFNFGSGTTTGGVFCIFPVNTTHGTNTALTTTGTAIAINDNNPHSFDMTITRTATSTLSFSATVDGTHTFTSSTTGVADFTFSSILLGEGNLTSGIDFNLDNVNVVVGLEQDQFNFVSEAATTSQTISADIASQTNPNSDARGGLMFRDGSGTNVPMVEVVSTTGGIVSLNWRGTTGGSYNSIHASGLFTTPPWLKLSRSGATFTGSYSTNGTTWTTIGSAPVTFTSGSPEVGMLASPQNNTQVEATTLSNVSITTP
jgi:xyloglucan-specific exo-beta-1,4-glucanase